MNEQVEYIEQYDEKGKPFKMATYKNKKFFYELYELTTLKAKKLWHTK